MISVPSPTGPKFVTTVHFQPLKMQRDAAEDLFGRRHRSTRIADQKSLAVTGCYQPPPGIFVKKSEHNNQMDGCGDEMVARRWHWRLWGGSLEFRGSAGWLLRIAAAGFGGGGGGRSTATMALRFASATATAAAATTTAMEGAATAVSAIVVAETMAATTATVMVTEVMTTTTTAAAAAAEMIAATATATMAVAAKAVTSGAKGERRRHRGKLMKKYALGLILLYFLPPPTRIRLSQAYAALPGTSR